jgi:hypothetical protein
MKVAIAILLSILIILAVHVCAQRFPTNNVTRAEAIKAASKLRVGMKEEAAAKMLGERGLQTGGSVGCSHGWTRFYLLSDGYTLGLEIAPKQARADGKWADGLLQSASIQSNGVKAVSIALTNAP